MDIATIVKLVIQSSPKNWLRLDPKVISLVPDLQVSSYAIYRDDISIAIAYASEDDSRPFEEAWTSAFSDPTAYKGYGIIFYQGTPILVASVISVDGARALLPLPKVNHSYSPDYLAFCQLLQQISGSSVDDHSNYVQKAGLTPDAALSWP
jgi:hypothetical protein